jgi:NAD(P)-dependent dehydrogenase (short-subunit alcohol dehydrogenase family)
MMQSALRDKVTLVTGAGSGLGEATARAFAGAGSTVALVDLDAGRAERVARELLAGDARVVALSCDVSDAAAVRETVDAVVREFGRLDVVVNCAAVDYVVSVDEMTIEQWDRVLGVNLRGPFLLAKAAWPIMRRQGGGHIVNIASTAATRAWGNAGAYHASKWGLRGFSRGLGVEGRADGIRVTTVIPGGMRTHFFDRFPEQGIPMPDEKNLQDPANVAQVILMAVQMPPESALQEVIVTPITETSWP